MFEGPFYSLWSLDEAKGLYITFCEKSLGLNILDISEGIKIRKKLINLKKTRTGKYKCNSIVKYGQLLTPKLNETERRTIVADIRQYYNSIK